MSNTNNITDITIEDYSEKAIVVRGNTTPYKEKIMKLGGKWNPKLRDGPGWIFPKTKKSSIEQWMASGEVIEAPRRVFSQNVTEEKAMTEDTFNKVIKNLGGLSVSELISLRDKVSERINQLSADDIEGMVEELEDSEEEQKPPRRSLLRK